MYTSHDLYRIPVIDRKWPPDKYQAWLAEMLIAALTGSPGKCLSDLNEKSGTPTRLRLVPPSVIKVAYF
jgi:hypothetical protein